MKNNYLEEVQFNKTDLIKISETTSCKDTAIIPKVKDAGEIYFDNHHNKFIQIPLRERPGL